METCLGWLVGGLILERGRGTLIEARASSLHWPSGPRKRVLRSLMMDVQIAGHLSFRGARGGEGTGKARLRDERVEDVYEETASRASVKEKPFAAVIAALMTRRGVRRMVSWMRCGKGKCLGLKMGNHNLSNLLPRIMVFYTGDSLLEISSLSFFSSNSGHPSTTGLSSTAELR